MLSYGGRETPTVQLRSGWSGAVWALLGAHNVIRGTLALSQCVPLGTWLGD